MHKGSFALVVFGVPLILALLNLTDGYKLLGSSVAFIPFFLIAIAVLLSKPNKKRARIARKPSWVTGAFMGVIVILFYLVSVWFVTTVALSPLKGFFYDQDYDAFIVKVEYKVANGSPDDYIVAAGDIEKRIEKGASPEKEKALAERGLEYLVSAAKMMPEGDEKRKALVQAHEWAVRHGLRTGEVDALIALAKPTPTPRPAPTLVPTPVPTAVPTMIPLRAGEDNPLIVPPPPYVLVRRIPLLLKSEPGFSPVGLTPPFNFVFNQNLVDLDLDGDEIIGFSGDGEKPWPMVFDDRFRALVRWDDGREEEFNRLFVANDEKGGIKGYQSQNVTWMFDTRRRHYVIQAWGIDVYPNVHSNFPVWILIYKKK